MQSRVASKSSKRHASTGIGKAKQANERMAHDIGKLWAIYKKFGPLGYINGHYKILANNP